MKTEIPNRLKKMYLFSPWMRHNVNILQQCDIMCNVTPGDGHNRDIPRTISIAPAFFFITCYNYREQSVVYFDR